ncbi:hypothetical protein [Roseomonas sp. HF4]|uniref:hypothetical protein n=1 Tax=Roseomonas sp. HF4 TaxID=2562313 RepID=UPI0010C0B286|nr:hypothetical protein [Roseomonas sp. HF4]
MDPDLVYRSENLVADHGPDGRISNIRNDRFGFHHIHDFPSVGGSFAEDWRDHVKKARDRFAHAASNWVGLDRPGRRILFVRYAIPGGRFVDRAEDLAALMPTLRRAFRYAEIDAVIVNAPVPEPRLRHLRVSERPEYMVGYQGDEEAWSAAFEGAGYRSLRHGTLADGASGGHEATAPAETSPAR